MGRRTWFAVSCASVSLAVCLTACSTNAEVVIDYDTTIDYAIGDVIIRDGVSPPTVIDIVEPARIGALEVLGTSIVNISGGQVGIGDDSSINDYATVNIFGGQIHRGVDVEDHSTFNMSGGVVSGYVNAEDFSNVQVLSGHVDNVFAIESGTVHISGGSVGRIRSGWSGGGPDTCVVAVYGTGFNYPYGLLPVSSGTLTGTLANGDPIDLQFEIHSNASIVLAIPEPSSLVSLGMGVLGLLAHAMHERRHSIASLAGLIILLGGVKPTRANGRGD